MEMEGSREMAVFLRYLRLAYSPQDAVASRRHLHKSSAVQFSNASVTSSEICASSARLISVKTSMARASSSPIIALKSSFVSG
jgi:hypothetical protein